MLRSILSFVFVLLLLSPALAVNPDEVLDDPVLEERARSLSVGIRCLVCQNQSIDDSDAQLARDLRIIVREKLVEGLNDKQILDYLVERYGEFVLLKPRLNNQTILLWLLPLIALIIGAIIALKTFGATKRKEVAEVKDLSKDEKEKLSEILRE
jgi:cytochrome c-type biogenesis protein CcmH